MFEPPKFYCISNIPYHFLTSFIDETLLTKFGMVIFSTSEVLKRDIRCSIYKHNSHHDFIFLLDMSWFDF